MARVQLYLRQLSGNPTFRFVRRGGVTETIPVLWLYAFVDLRRHVRPGQNAGTAAFPDCIIDTGSHLTLIPERIWSQFWPNAVTRLPFDPAMTPGQRVTAFGGGSWPYELGELAIQLRDLAGRVMDLTVVAQFTRDRGKITLPMVLGLRGRVIDGRILRAEPDVAAPFGQAWILEDP